jgi:hypothetical protein
MHIQVSKVRILASTSFLFRPSTVLMPNLAQIEMKRITVQPNQQAVVASMDSRDRQMEIHF